MNKLAISIINYKTKELTKRCLESILDKKWKSDLDIWLLDNASNDGSVESLKKSFSDIKIVESTKNLGFAGGHNLTLKGLNSEYVLILNSDTEVDNSLDAMVEFMDQNPDVGIASCKILGFDGKLQPNGGDLPFGMALLNWLFNLDNFGIKSSFHRMESDYYQNAHEVGWVSGSFMIIRQSVLKKVGYFNEKYFMYFEDVDLCFRTKQAGFKIMINPKTFIEHLSGGSSSDPNLKQWRGEFQGLLIFYKQFGILAETLILLLLYATTAMRIIAFGLTGKFKTSLTYVKVISSI